MERKLFGETVLQKSKSEFFSATDLVKAGNKWRIMRDMPMFNLSAWLKTKSTVEFIEELKEQFGKVISRGEKTWIHPFLFIDLALALSPRLKIETYSWLHDHLLQNRNISGESFKRMSGALWAHQGNKRNFPQFMTILSERIRTMCGVTDWQTATEEQLQHRNQIHTEIAAISDVLKHNGEAVRLALLNHKKPELL